MPVATSLTNVFTFNGVIPGVYSLSGELYATVVGTGTTTITTAFSGTAGTISLNVGRFSTAGAPAFQTLTSFTASTGSTWVWAKINCVFTVSALGALTIGCTRTGGTSHTILIASYIELDQTLL